MADRHSPDNIDRELEDLLTSHRDRIAYPEMADSVSTARQRIESATTPVAVGSSLETTPLDDWDDEPEQINRQRPTPIDHNAPGKLRQALTLAAAALAIFIVGGVLIAVLPGVIDDESQSGAVLGPDTTGYEFAGTIGGPMIPNEPVDVAVDSQGNIYAADIATRSVHKFDPEGAHLASWTAEDAEVGPFTRPWSLAIENDTLYVLDRGQAAIYRLDTDGAVLDSWRVGDPQDSTSLFTGIDVNQHGHVYITNPNAGDIVIYESNGTHIADIQVADDPQSGGERPLDVAVKDDGRMYVTNFTGNEIRYLDTNGTYIDSVLTAELAELGIPDPPSFYGITLGADGYLYTVSDRSAAKFDLDHLQRVAGWDFNPQPDGSAGFPSQGISVDSDGVMYVADTTNQRIIGYAIGSTDPMIEIIDTREGHFSTPGGIEVDDEGSLYVADSIAQRVTKFATDGSVLNDWTWQSDSTPPIGTFPGDVAVTEDHLYILDGIREIIVKLAVDGEKVHEWTGELLGPDMWSQASGIDIDTNGTLYLINRGDTRILTYDADGQFLKEWSPIGAGTERQESSAMDVLADTVYVAYVAGSMPGIWTLDLDGNVMERAVKFNNSEGATPTIPASIAVAPTGDIFTVDAFSRMVRWYSPDGVLKSEWTLTENPRQAQGFVYIEVDESGTVFISDGDTRQVLVYEPVSE